MVLRNILICVLTALVAVLSFAASPTRADDVNRFSELRVAVWPEYDKPSVLVLIDGVLADQTNLPREIYVFVPTGAQGIIATFENSDGSLAAEQSFKTEKQDEGWSRLSYTIQTPRFHVEYYDNVLQSTPDKQIDFKFRVPVASDKVTVEFQQPLKASNFNVTPPTSTTRNESGFTYYVQDFANASAGQTLAALVKYTKTDPSPSVSPVSLPPAAQSAVPATTASGPWSSIYVVAGLVVLGCAAFVGFMMIRQRGQHPTSRTATHKQRRGGRKSAKGGSQYCTQCGHALMADNLFCPHCGARRKAV